MSSTNNRQGYLQVLFLSKNHHWLEQATRKNYISQYHRELPYAAEFQPSCILHTLGPCPFVYSFNCTYAEGFLVVFDMHQCKITLKMSPALYQKEEEELYRLFCLFPNSKSRHFLESWIKTLTVFSDKCHSSYYDIYIK
jgi:hypothetical protein